MEKDKQKFLDALKANNGNVDEYALGNSLGFSDEKTKQIIGELVTDGKIVFQSFGLCSYRVTK